MTGIGMKSKLPEFIKLGFLIFKSDDTAYPITSPEYHNNVRCTVSADLKKGATNPLFSIGADYMLLLYLNK